MNDEDRLNTYFSARADSLAVPPRNPVSVTDDVAHRRTRRLVSVSAVGAFAMVAAVAVVARPQPSATTRVELPGSAPTVPLQWTAVDLPAGLGFSRQTTVGDDGSIYSLSTAPGPYNPAAPEARLWSSGDGRTWAEQRLPAGLSAGTLGVGGGNVYALGTAAAGGDLVIASKADGSTDWESKSLPSPRADLIARHPREVSITDTDVAAGPGGVIAAVTVKAHPDLMRLLAGKDIGGGVSTMPTADGVAVRCVPGPPGTVPGSIPPRPEPTTPGTAPPRPPCDPADDRTYTWEELGLDPELRALVGGETHLYRSVDGGPYTEVPTSLPAGTVQALFGTAGGYRVLITAGERAQQLSSADGLTWQSSGPALETGQYGAARGLFNGRPAVVFSVAGATVRLLTADAAGVWTAHDLTLVAPGSESQGEVTHVALGPLGLVALVTSGSWVSTEGNLVTSSDGATVAVTPIAPLIGEGKWSVGGLLSTADAVVVRLTKPDPTAGPGTTPDPAQRLLVGTPS